MTGLVLGLLMLSPTAEVKLSVTAGGKSLGSATVSQGLLSDGGKSVMVTLTLGSGANLTKVRQESVYASNGEPRRKIQEVISANGKKVQSLVATFDAEGATVRRTEGAKAFEKKVPLVAKAPRAALAEFWFIRDKPKAGERVAYYRFDLSSLRWVLDESTYVGMKTVQVAGRSVKAHEVRGGAGLAYQDEKGDPLLTDVAGVKMERIWGK